MSTDQELDEAQAEWAQALADRLAVDPRAVSGASYPGARVSVVRPAFVGRWGSVDVESANGSVHVDYRVSK